jgi:uncharacterized repeat protein (TIGR03806 family)
MAAAALAAACSSSEEEPDAGSPCVAFAKAAPPALKVDTASPAARSGLLKIVQVGGTTYALDREGRLGRIDADTASLVTITGATDFVVTKDATGPGLRAFVVKRALTGPSIEFQLQKLTSADGLTFGQPQALITEARASTLAESGLDAVALGPSGQLFVAIGDAGAAQTELGTLFGKVLRIDVTGNTYDVPTGNPVPAASGRPEIWAIGVHQPRGLDLDGETGDLWLTDFSAKDDATVVHRIVRGSGDVLEPILFIPAADKRATAAGGHVYRGKLVPALAGRYVYPADNGQLMAIDRFGPSGTALATRLAVGETGPFARGEDKELLLAAASGAVGRVVDSAPPGPAPASLLATKCWDPAAPAGVPAGAIAYDVTTALWSDGAAKDRFVVVPKGTKITSRSDGDLVFPVGTVAVKTFAVDGKRIETRLLVQQDIEDWVGYSYAWNEAGSDAELVLGNRVAPLAGGKSWYFPSPADCSACHTPAAGYTLGLDAKQLVGHGEALARLEASLDSPLQRGALATLVPVDAPPPATAEARARSYLDANCSGCHRQGSVTGTVVDLDLRLEIPLANTGLCKEPGAGSLGIPGARIVTPGDPARSVIVARMRSLDDRRMPKLASRVVDEAGVAAVEAWIRTLASCP